MSKRDEQEIRPFPRLPTGVPGLDDILMGGLLRGGIYLIMGKPGAGKTILANQIGFHHVAGGKRALYVSLLSEGHSRLFGHLKPMKFFAEDAISDSFVFISAYHTLEKEGLEGLLKSLAQMVRQYRADLLFLDGVASAEELAKSPVSFKEFVHDLNTVLSASGCTAILLSSFVESTGHPEHTMVDGIISLTDFYDGMRSVREVEVKKLRGSGHMYGRHVFTISDLGIRIYPRIEALWSYSEPPADVKMKKISTGVPKLDGLFDGGIMSGSVTSVLGAAGTGKTLLGVRFLVEGAERGEHGLYLGLYEHPHRLVRKVENASISLEKQIASGKLTLLWQPPLENAIDEMAQRLLEVVRKTNAKRVFIDGMGGLKDGMVHPARFQRVLAAIANRLRSFEVTTFITEETELFPFEVKTPISDYSAVVDNIVYLRHVDFNSELVRFISVIKSRDSYSSGCIHKFQITEKGIEIGEQFQGVEQLFTGVPRKT